VTTWNYNTNRGWLDNKRYDDGTGPDYAYKASGKLAAHIWSRTTNSARITTSFGYNATSGDLESISYSDGTPSVTYTYDRLGRQRTIVQNGMTNTLAYNDANQVLSESYSGGTLGGLSVTNAYNSILLRSLTTVPAKITNSFSYDGARLTNVTDGNYSAGYAYLANSPLIAQITFKDGNTVRMTTSKQYDFLNRLQSINNAPALASESQVSFYYTYNSANQRTRVSLNDGSFWLYGYDSLGQVTSGKKYFNDWTPVPGQQFEYGFDAIGNRTSTAEGGDQGGSNLRSATYSNNTLNQLTSRTVPNKIDLIGLAGVSATVSVNGDSSGVFRKDAYFRKEQSVTSDSYPTITVQATAGGTNSTQSGALFIPPATENFGYDADGNCTNDGRWAFTLGCGEPPHTVG
jgi:hypothetical protein